MSFGLVGIELDGTPKLLLRPFPIKLVVPLEQRERGVRFSERGVELERPLGGSLCLRINRNRRLHPKPRHGAIRVTQAGVSGCEGGISRDRLLEITDGLLKTVLRVLPVEVAAPQVQLVRFGIRQLPGWPCRDFVAQSESETSSDVLRNLRLQLREVRSLALVAL